MKVYKGLELTDDILKEKYIFEETAEENGGRRLVYRCHIAPTSGPVSPIHLHTLSDEKFLVLEGEIRVHLDGGWKKVRKGETLIIKRGTPHTGYNNGPEEAVVLCTIEPAHTMGEYIYSMVRLSNRGKTNRKNLPNLFTIAAMGYKYREQAFIPRCIFLQRFYFSTVGFLVSRLYDLLHIDY